jgi:2-dehydropantoate 2-reductase
MPLLFTTSRFAFRRCRRDLSTTALFSNQVVAGEDLWKEPIQIHILGAGSIGLLLAASLRIAFPSYPVRLLLREHHRMKSNKNDKPTVLVNLLHNRRLRTVQVPSQIISDEFVPQRKFRNLLITTKSYQVITALQSIQHCLQFDNDSTATCTTAPTNIVVLSNGAMAIRDDILSHFPNINPSQLRIALTTHGAYRLPNHNNTDNDTECNYFEESSETDDSSSVLMMDVVHAGLGRLDFPESLKAWTPIFDRAGLQAHTLTDSEMEQQLWCKLAANCLINPLTALYQCTNGDVVQTPEWDNFLVSIPEEVARVAQAYLGNQVAINASMLREFCQQVVAATTSNQSSMLQDVKAGRRTEIDALNGYIVKMGLETGVEVPANRDLYNRILCLGGSET